MSFQVYRSSAGSGKTTTLVLEYLKLILRSDQKNQFKHVLAITFTNKAANEMKERIFETLEILGDPHKPLDSIQFMSDALCKHLQIGEDVLRERAQKTLLNILHNYADISVSTIDSFTSSVVRSFAFDLKIPFQFQIELNQKKLLNEAVDRYMHTACDEEKESKVLIEYIRERIFEKGKVQIRKDLEDASKLLLNDSEAWRFNELQNMEMQTYLEIIEKLSTHKRKAENQIDFCAEAIVLLIEERGYDSSAFHGGKNGLISLPNKLKKRESITATHQKHFEKGEWTKKPDTDFNAEINAHVGSALNSLQAIRKINLFYKNVYQQATLNAIQKHYVELKDEYNVLPISDLNKRISEVILSEPVPFIYERIGERYENYMVDEFQDTSVIQWMNLLPLYENALSKNHFCMIVGDGKQAIYRFRGGEVEQFLNLPNIYTPKNQNFDFVKEREQILKQHYESKNLNQNFRSRREIIEFNNTLFEHLGKSLHDNYKALYEGEALKQAFNPNKTGGLVSVKQLPVNKESGEKTRDVIKQALEPLLEKLIRQGKEYNASDIAILCRSNNECKEIAEWLKEWNYGIYSAESLLVANAKEIKLIHALLVWFTQKTEAIHAFHVWIRLAENELINLDTLPNDNLKHKPSELCFLLAEKGFKLQFPNEIDSIAELVYSLLRQLPQKCRTSPYMDAFLNLIHEFSARNGEDLPGFLHYWEEQKDSTYIHTAPHKDAIQLITFHKSKGLQFPVVIMPMKTTKRPGSSVNLWSNYSFEEVEIEHAYLTLSKTDDDSSYSPLYEEEVQRRELDDINTYYVAFTRAVEQMHILIPQNDTGGSIVPLLKTFRAWCCEHPLFNPETLELTIAGEHKTPKHPKNEENTQILVPTLPENTHWKNRIKLSTLRIEKQKHNAEEQAFGIALHDVLAHIKSANDLPTALRKGAVVYPEIDFQKIENQIREILEHEVLKSFFTESTQVWNECEWMDEKQNILRPDRVCYANYTWAIIDYKSGKEHNSHSEQIKKYGRYFKEFKQTEARLFLVYTDNASVLEVENT
jgi:ATP-dependent exoDNAse (exonuclease V) beta subunit